MNYAVLVLTGTYRETEIQTRGLTSASVGRRFRFDVFYLKVESLINRKNVRKILIDCRNDFSTGIFAGLEEIRERIEALKTAGKEVFFYSDSYSGPQLYLASACSYRLLHPMGTLRFFGLSQSFTFMKGLMRKLGIDTEIIRRGRYKSAGDSFGKDKLEDPNREQYEHFLSTVMETISSGIKSGFEKNDDDLAELLDGRVLSAEEAADASWIDEIVNIGSFRERWKSEGDKEIKFRKTPVRSGKRFVFGTGEVAVLVFEGAVIDGHSRRDPVLGQAIGSDSFIPQIIKLKEDKKVKAVVFRINSGGGSAFASENITSELRLLAEKKPLIVSMSEVAGSGGYWMSCCGRKTYALPTTLTGSIGVISIYPSWPRLLERLGINHETLRNGEHADAGSPLRGLSVKEKSIVDSEIDNMYKGFINMVAEFRQLPVDAVDSIAQGRIWPGVTATRHKLVDESGGLTDSIRIAASEAGVKNPVLKFYPQVKHSLVERLIMNVSKEDEETIEAASLIKSLSKLIGKSTVKTGPVALMEEELFRWI